SADHLRGRARQEGQGTEGREPRPILIQRCGASFRRLASFSRSLRKLKARTHLRRGRFVLAATRKRAASSYGCAIAYARWCSNEKAPDAESGVFISVTTASVTAVSVTAPSEVEVHAAANDVGGEVDVVACREAAGEAARGGAEIDVEILGLGRPIG